MPTIETEVEFEVRCSVHIHRILAVSIESRKGNNVYVESCEDCLGDEYDKGYAKGKKEADNFEE